MTQRPYTYLSWRGDVVPSERCLSCSRADGGHDDTCTEPAYRDFTPTERAELDWLNDRLDTIDAERKATGIEDLHWQEHRSICRSLKAITEAAQGVTATRAVSA